MNSYDDDDDDDAPICRLRKTPVTPQDIKDAAWDNLKQRSTTRGRPRKSNSVDVNGEHDFEDDEPLVRPRTLAARRSSGPRPPPPTNPRARKRAHTTLVPETVAPTDSGSVTPTEQSTVGSTTTTGRRKPKVNVKTEDDSDRSLISIHFKEGQKAPCPPVGDGTRAFYESLFQEKPHSIMAIRYCIEHGVLIGTQQKETLRRYYALKEAGAFRGSQGGIKTLILNQVNELLQSDRCSEVKVPVPIKKERKLKRT